MEELIKQLEGLDNIALVALKNEIDAMLPKMADFVKTGEHEGIITRKLASDKYSVLTTSVNEDGKFKTVSVGINDIETVSKIELPEASAEEISEFSKVSFEKEGRKYYGFVFGSHTKKEETYYKVLIEDTVATVKDVTIEDEIKETEVVNERIAFNADIKKDDVVKELMKSYNF